MQPDTEFLNANARTFAEAVAFQQYIAGMSKLPWANEISLKPYKRAQGVFSANNKNKKPVTPPIFDDHHDDDKCEKLDVIIHLLHKLNKKLERLIMLSSATDFSREDASVRGMTRTVAAAKKRIPTPRTTNKKG